MLFGVPGDLYWQSIQGGILRDVLYKDISSLHLFAEREIFGVMIFKYGGTCNLFFDGIKCFSMFRSPYKWYIFSW